jgi:hypothetical protein
MGLFDFLFGRRKQEEKAKPSTVHPSSSDMKMTSINSGLGTNSVKMGNLVPSSQAKTFEKPYTLDPSAAPVINLPKSFRPKENVPSREDLGSNLNY